MGPLGGSPGANELDRRVSTGDQAAKSQVSEHPVDRDRGGKNVLKHLPDRANKFPFLVDTRGTHHEAGPTVGQLHDGGAGDVEQDADQDVGTFKVPQDQQSHPQRQDVQQGDERARVTAHLKAKTTEQEHHTERDNDHPKRLEQPLQIAGEYPPTL